MAAEVLYSLGKKATNRRTDGVVPGALKNPLTAGLSDKV